jgi:hypothetical protein
MFYLKLFYTTLGFSSMEKYFFQNDYVKSWTHCV